MPPFEILAATVPGFLIIMLGLIAIYRNPSSATNRYFFLFAVSSAVWLALNYVAGSVAFPYLIILAANRAVLLFAGLSLFGLAVFVRSLINHQTVSPRVWLAIKAVNILIAALTCSPLVVADVVREPQIYAIVFGPLEIPYFLTLVLNGAFVVAVMVIARKKTTDYLRSQIDTVLLSMTVGLTGILFTNGFLPFFVHNYALTNVGPFFVVLFIGGVAYAMIYHGLFDLQFFIIRAILYLTSFVVLTVLWVTPAVVGFTRLFGLNPKPHELVLIVLAGVVTVYALGYLREGFNKLTNKIFFRYYYNPQDVLDKLSTVLVRTVDEKTLEEESAAAISDALRPHFTKYLLLTSEHKKEVQLTKKLLDTDLNLVIADELNSQHDKLKETLREAEIAVAVKLSTTHEDLGFIVLGHKLSGGVYPERDRRLLRTMADEIAISLQNALRFKEIQRFNLTLQEKVDRATYQLRRTNKRLEELDEIKDDFIGMASHQLRTPLTSIKGYLSMVLEGDAGKLNATQVKMLRQAFISSQRMVYLITDLLNVSRLKTGKFIIDAAPTDLSAVIQDEVAQLREAAEARSVKLAYDKPTNFPQLMLDETKTRQVIMNFIDNAIYYTPAGGSIHVELVDKPATIELRVIDTGIGVPKNEQYHLFTKFYRAANARKARPDGTGLGLFMAKKVIAAQGGSIIFSSKQNQGSTFGFVFSKSRLKIPEPVPSDSK